MRAEGKDVVTRPPGAESFASCHRPPERCTCSSGAALLSITLGCGGSREPGDVAGSYRLTTVDASTPPSTVSAGVACDERITEGSLLLTANGEFMRRYVTALDCGGEQVARAQESAGVFFLKGRRILLDVSARPGNRIQFEGEARGIRFVMLVREFNSAGRELELGFEPATGRGAE